ncbi:MAG TPA: hypothetical protein VFP37_08825 [Steroidobacteraceae bacterium]|nr:hypothetical protein [Steroidobacteraceae bacterium]
MGSAQRQAGVFIAVAGLGALASIFGPSERWGILDVGSTGTALTVLAMGALIWLLAMRGDQVFPEHMSIAERRAWAGLAFIAIILLKFMRQLWVLSGVAAIPEYIHGLLANDFMQSVAVLLVLWAVVSRLIRRSAAGPEVDERDLRLRHRADRAGDWALTLIVIAGISVLASVPAARLSWWLSPIVLANLLIGLLIAKSLVEHVALTLAYRSGRA